MSFDKHTHPQNHHHCQDTEPVHHPKGSPVPFPVSPHLIPTQPLTCSLSLQIQPSESLINGIT